MSSPSDFELQNHHDDNADWNNIKVEPEFVEQSTDDDEYGVAMVEDCAVEEVQRFLSTQLHGTSSGRELGEIVETGFEEETGSPGSLAIHDGQSGDFRNKNSSHTISNVWAHFADVLEIPAEMGANGQMMRPKVQARCIYCDKIVRGTKRVTSNFITHLKSHHKEQFPSNQPEPVISSPPVPASPAASIARPTRQPNSNYSLRERIVPPKRSNEWTTNANGKRESSECDGEDDDEESTGEDQPQIVTSHRPSHEAVKAPSIGAGATSEAEVVSQNRYSSGQGFSQKLRPSASMFQPKVDISTFRSPPSLPDGEIDEIESGSVDVFNMTVQEVSEAHVVIATKDMTYGNSSLKAGQAWQILQARDLQLGGQFVRELQQSGDFAVIPLSAYMRHTQWMKDEYRKLKTEWIRRIRTEPSFGKQHQASAPSKPAHLNPNMASFMVGQNSRSAHSGFAIATPNPSPVAVSNPSPYASKLMKHEEESHQGSASAAPAHASSWVTNVSLNDRIKCTRCDARMSHYFNLRGHLLSHFDERAYMCALCQRPFKTEQGILNHQFSDHQRPRNTHMTAKQLQYWQEAVTKNNELIKAVTAEYNQAVKDWKQSLASQDPKTFSVD